MVGESAVVPLSDDVWPSALSAALSAALGDAAVHHPGRCRVVTVRRRPVGMLDADGGAGRCRHVVAGLRELCGRRRSPRLTAATVAAITTAREAGPPNATGTTTPPRVGLEAAASSTSRSTRSSSGSSVGIAHLSEPFDTRRSFLAGLPGLPTAAGGVRAGRLQPAVQRWVRPRSPLSSPPSCPPLSSPESSSGSFPGRFRSCRHPGCCRPRRPVVAPVSPWSSPWSSRRSSPWSSGRPGRRRCRPGRRHRVSRSGPRWGRRSGPRPARWGRLPGLARVVAGRSRGARPGRGRWVSPRAALLLAGRAVA